MYKMLSYLTLLTLSPTLLRQCCYIIFQQLCGCGVLQFQRQEYGQNYDKFGGTSCQRRADDPRYVINSSLISEGLTEGTVWKRLVVEHQNLDGISINQLFKWENIRSNDQSIIGSTTELIHMGNDTASEGLQAEIIY